jgi:phosphate transport system substrate-binding protein
VSIAAMVSLYVAPLVAATPSLKGAGATFPSPLYVTWAAHYGHASGTEIQYEPVGSVEGVARFERGVVDFGATDIPLEHADLQRLCAAQFPIVIGGVVPVMNLGGLKPGELRLTGEILADIYLGKIRRWDAPSVARLNPGLVLPHAFITVVHRSDASGTTFLWSRFLTMSSEEWKSKIGVDKVLSWPVGVSAVGNRGVASAVQRTRDSIGYVEYTYARQHNLITASLRNHDGEFVAPSPQSFEAAARAKWEDQSKLEEGILDEPGVDSWPMTSATFIVLSEKRDRSSRTREVEKFFDWAMHGGRKLAEQLHYVPLPEAAVQRIVQKWERDRATASQDSADCPLR